MKKKCTKCGEIKSFSEFHKKRRAKSGVRSLCKICASTRRKAHYRANADKVKVQGKLYYEANAEKISAQKKIYREANADKIKAYKEVYEQVNADKIKARRQAHYQANAERLKANQKIYDRKRYRTDAVFRLKNSYRGAVKRGFRLTSDGKDIRSLDCLGCSWDDFVSYIVSQFYDHPETGEKMTLENHGFYGWHLDHITPLFYAKTKEDVIRLSHYTNFQPLWAEENLTKGNKILDKS